MPDTATRILRDQHRNILRIADVLQELVVQELADLDAVADCITFIRLYADALHHGKEEDLLFPELEGRGMSRDAGPIAVMLEEHRLGREWVKAMADALPGAREGDAEATARLETAAMGYVQLIRGHILKEDNVLFNWADQMVTGPACRSLCHAYDGVCQRSFDGCTVAQLEAILERLLARYPEA
jgi:hemerythrin-like domain-containing protein